MDYYRTAGSLQWLKDNIKHDPEDKESIHTLTRTVAEFICNMADGENRMHFYAGLSSCGTSEIHRKKQYLQSIHKVIVEHVLESTEAIDEVVKKLTASSTALTAAHLHIEMLKYRQDMLVTSGIVSDWIEFLCGILIGRHMNE